MKNHFKLAASLVLFAGIAGCEPLGDGNTVEKLALVLTPTELEQGVAIAATDTAPARLKMYDCFCANLAALATFTDGTVSNFIYRAEFSSSNPAVVSVLNAGDDPGDRCAVLQESPGALIPNGLGSATITARFGELSATIEIDVVETAPLAAGNFTLGPVAPATSTAIVVGTTMPLSLTGTLDGRSRSLARNVLSWTLDPENTEVATINTLGQVSGVAVDPAGAARTARASFGDNCPVVVETPVSVGDILGPLSLAREPGFVADGDTLLATNSDERLDVTAGLDFNNDGVEDGQQVLNGHIALSFEDDCTLRVYDAAVPTTNCAETAGTCTNTTPACAESTATSCPSTLTTACRTEAASIIAPSSNRIIAVSDGDSPVQFSATYPHVRGTPTTLAADITDAATTLEVAELTGYPVIFPWYGVIDKLGAREDVRVTAASGTVLTVVRGVTSGVAGSAAGPHAAGATFEQRSYASTTPLGIQADESTLTAVDVIDPASALTALGTLQVHAQGTFTDATSATREQRVTRLTTFATGSPTVSWGSGDTAVAAVTPTGLVISRTACGGSVTIRARASTSTNTDDETFDADSTVDDDACLADELCDQVNLCIARLDPLPDGTVCEDPAPACP